MDCSQSGPFISVSLGDEVMRIINYQFGLGLKKPVLKHMFTRAPKGLLKPARMVNQMLRYFTQYGFKLVANFDKCCKY